MVARRKETLISPMVGIVRGKGITVGNHVRKGMTVITVSLPLEDAVKKKQDYEFAKMDLEVSTQQLAGARQLLEAKAISEQEYRALEITKLKQEMNVRNLHDGFMNRAVKANFDGTLIEEQCNDGDHVTAGAPLCTVIDTHSLAVEISVPQHLISNVKMGQKVEYSSDVSLGKLAGRVIELPAIADAQSTQQGVMTFTEPQFTVTATISGFKDIPLIGSSVVATFIIALDEKMLFVPEDAVLLRSDRPVVFVSSSGRALAKEVKMGLTNLYCVEILSGLTKADTVVTTGNIDLSDRDRITSMESEESIRAAKYRSRPIFVPR
ncbi:MAG: efflux RND transporter periplasmic adaptor subunit [Bacteroidetes bacterium]|nr:efflux RND transporter periplasmic adaptor subunit [Bacteroidota bacterium]